MRLIDASVLQEEYKKRHDGKRLLLIDAAPTVDAVPVVHGEWVDDGDPLTLVCGVCGYRVMRYNNTRHCPDCGARMDGKEQREGAKDGIAEEAEKEV